MMVKSQPAQSTTSDYCIARATLSTLNSIDFASEPIKAPSYQEIGFNRVFAG